MPGIRSSRVLPPLPPLPPPPRRAAVRYGRVLPHRPSLYRRLRALLARKLWVVPLAVRLSAGQGVEVHAQPRRHYTSVGLPYFSPGFHLRPMFYQGSVITGFLEDTTNLLARVGDPTNKAIRVNVVAGGAAGGTSQGDNTALANLTAAGALYDTTPPAVTDGNVGVFRMSSSRILLVDCQSGCSGSSFADNAAFTFGTTVISVGAGVLDDTAPNAATENSAAAFRISANRMQLFQLGDGAGNERRAGVNASNQLDVAVGNTVTVQATNLDIRDLTATDVVTVTDGAGALNTIVDSGTLTCNAGTNLNTSALALDATLTNRLPAGSTPADNESNAITASRLPTYSYIFDGTTWDRWTGAVSGTVSCNLNAGTNNVGDVDVASIAAGDNNIGNVDVVTLPALPAGTNNIGDVDVLTLPSVTIGTFPDNEPINVAQMNGVAVTMGNGAAGTGVQRVTLASDSTGNIATIGTSVTPGTAATNLGKAEDAAAASGDVGPAPLIVREDTPTSTAGANGDYIAPKANLWGHQFVNSMCQDPNLVTSAVISTATSGNVEIVALTASQTIYVCSWDVMATGTVAFQWIYGTGTACATGETNLTGAYPLIAQVGLAPDAGGGILFKTAVSNALCIELGGAVQVDGRVSYVKF